MIITLYLLEYHCYGTRPMPPSEGGVVRPCFENGLREVPVPFKGNLAELVKLIGDQPLNPDVLPYSDGPGLSWSIKVGSRSRICYWGFNENEESLMKLIKEECQPLKRNCRLLNTVSQYSEGRIANLFLRKCKEQGVYTEDPERSFLDRLLDANEIYLQRLSLPVLALEADKAIYNAIITKEEADLACFASGSSLLYQLATNKAVQGLRQIVRGGCLAPMLSCSEIDISDKINEFVDFILAILTGDFDVAKEYGNSFRGIYKEFKKVSNPNKKGQIRVPKLDFEAFSGIKDFYERHAKSGINKRYLIPIIVNLFRLEETEVMANIGINRIIIDALCGRLVLKNTDYPCELTSDLSPDSLGSLFDVTPGRDEVSRIPLKFELISPNYLIVIRELAPNSHKSIAFKLAREQELMLAQLINACKKDKSDPTNIATDFIRMYRAQTRDDLSSTSPLYESYTGKLSPITGTPQQTDEFVQEDSRNLAITTSNTLPAVSEPINECTFDALVMLFMSISQEYDLSLLRINLEPRTNHILLNPSDGFNPVIWNLSEEEKTIMKQILEEYGLIFNLCDNPERQLPTKVGISFMQRYKFQAGDRLSPQEIDLLSYLIAAAERSLLL